MTAYRLTQGGAQARFDSLGHLTHLGHPDHIRDTPSLFHLQGPMREGYWSVNCGGSDIPFDPETTHRDFDYTAGRFTLTSPFRGPGAWWGLDLSRSYTLEQGLLRCDFTLRNWSPASDSPTQIETDDGQVCSAAPIARLRYQTGVNCWTDYSSDWHHRPYPNSLRVERDFFWGACVSMSHEVIGWFSATKTDGWQTIYESTGNQRVRSVAIDFINAMDAHPARHGHQTVKLGRENPAYTGTFYVGRFESIEDLWHAAARTLGVAFLSGRRYTGFTGETLTFDVIRPDNAPKPVKARITDEMTGVPLETVEVTGGRLSLTLTGGPGRRVIELDAGGRTTESRVWQHVDWRETLRTAAHYALKHKPPSGYNAESILALITLSQAGAYLGDDACREAAAKTLRRVYEVHYDPATGVHRTMHHRLQNYGSLLDAARIYHECFGVTDEIDPLRRSAGQLLSLQRDDGNFYRHHVIYNNVIHPVKSLFDWGGHLRQLGHTADADRAVAAVERAYRCIARAGDDTQTEGSEHFEDGMTACSAYQIASLWPHFGKDPAHLKTAMEIYRKRRMLKCHLPDSRFFAGTLRHWETYWAMGLGQAMLAGHGWAAWSASLAHALFMATGDWACLTDAYATVTNCLQSADPETGRFHFGIVVDPHWRDYYGLGTQHPGEEYLTVPDEVRVAGEAHAVFLTLHDSFYKQTYLRITDRGIDAFNGRIASHGPDTIELDSFALSPREVVVVNASGKALPRIRVNGQKEQRVVEITA